MIPTTTHMVFLSQVMSSAYFSIKMAMVKAQAKEYKRPKKDKAEAPIHMAM